ncbi:hypothetical protein CK203_089056 [Vitis vinifera]|uniref:DUF4283 domain-containing protein n=1 Tax=Vitis vinifera TaxID=29760 RepID=A0A438F5L8_VITVI|nr:hypothetical protein CK203_089056 [Vitis vinifera]
MRSEIKLSHQEKRREVERVHLGEMQRAVFLDQIWGCKPWLGDSLAGVGEEGDARKIGTIGPLFGRLNIVVLGRGLLLFEFELLSEAEQVLARGKRRVKENILFLEKWNPEVGCFCKGAITNEAWARVVGGGSPSSSLELRDRGWVGLGGFSIQIWWETQPWFTQVVPSRRCLGVGVSADKDEARGSPRAMCGGSLLENEGQSKVQVEGYRTCRPLEAIQRVLQPFLLHPLQEGLSKALRRMLWKEVK